MRLVTKLTLACFFIAAQLIAQNSELYHPLNMSDRPKYSDDLPEFVKMTFRPNLNMKDIEEAFEAYEKANRANKKRYRTEGGIEDEVEDKYNVYFHRWKDAYGPYAQEDGTIVLPTVAEFKQKIRGENRVNANRLALRSGAANWTNVGPKETFWLKDDNATQPPCPWQVNIYAFDISKSNPNILYAAPETGGIFKTIDKGLNWTACGSSTFDFGNTISSIEIHPTNPNIAYASAGSFFYKTTDGGNTWTDLTAYTGSDASDIAISPADPNIILVAADNGFYRTTDGGNTWTRVFTTACYDIELNPSDPTHVFLLKLNSASTYVEFLKSTDSGATFTVKNTSTTDLGAGRLTVSAADPNRIYILCTGGDINTPHLLKSLNEGEAWTEMNAPFCTGGISDATGGQGYYDLSITASQTDANQVIFGLCTTSKAVSTDGGNTFTFSHIGGYCGSFKIHPDLQEVKCINNGGQLETWIATDGGLTYSTDFFTNTSNAVARNNGIYSTQFWGYGQGWNEDIMVGGRYHNGNTALAGFYPSGKALRMGGAESGTGYVLQGDKKEVIFSDVDGWRLPDDFYSYANGRFSYGKYPNEDSYGRYATPFVFHPNYYKQQFVGNENILWKTDDNGFTFVALKDFGNHIQRFAISRSNPSVLYLATAVDFNKSTDSGLTWSSVALPTGRSAANLYLAVNPNNEQDIWICFYNISGSGKIYQSTDGGSTWTNKDGTTLGSLKIKNIVHTGGGVYITVERSDGKVFYRSINATDWTDFSDNLPISMDIRRMEPFYRDGKLRVAGNRGIWETPLAESVPPLAMPTVDKNSTTCIRDTFYFDDYSILKHASATWTWSFTNVSNPSTPPQYVSDIHARKPKVVFGSVGYYSVTLTVNDGTASNTKTVTNMINVTSDGNCDLSTVIGKAMSCSTDGDYLKTTAFNLNKNDGSNTNEITVMAWVKPSGIQSSFAGILSCNGENVNLNLRSNNELGIHWHNEAATYNWSSGLTIPADEWSHVALVVTPTEFRLYLNGKEAIKTYTVVQLDLSSNEWYIGIDRGNTGRTFKGLIDEAAFFNRALTKDEIREKMHLMKNPATDASLKGYYQFDETGGFVWNKALPVSSAFNGGATRVLSTAPVAIGTSQRTSVTTGGAKDFPSQNLILTFPSTGILPNGDVVITELNAAPDQTPSSGTPLSTKYWIVENYGSNANFMPLTNVQFKNLTGFATGTASNFKLYKRNANADGATWGTTIDGADNLTGSDLTFTPIVPCMGVASFGQFALVNDASVVPPSATSAPCYPDTIPNQAASFSGSGSSYVISSEYFPNAANDDFSISFWMKSSDAGNPRTILGTRNVSSSTGNASQGWAFVLRAGILHFELGDGSTVKRVQTSFTVNDGTWHYIAGTVNNTGNMELFVDGVSIGTQSVAALGTISNAGSTASNNTNSVLGLLYFGKDNHGTGAAYPYTGQIDEVKIWNVPLTINDIRQKKHLTAYQQEPNLVGYYQFNNTTTGTLEYDRKGTNILTINGASRVVSTAPVGGGVSSVLTVTSSGIKTFAGTDCEMEFPSGTLPNGDIVVTKLNIAPDQLPTAVAPLSNKYWVVNNYGASPFTALTSIKFSNLAGFAGGIASNYKLFKRPSNADGATWGTEIDAADILNNAALTFSTGNNITSFSQFTIAKDVVIGIELLDFKAVAKEKRVELTWQVADEKDLKFYVIERSFDGKNFRDLTQSPKGTFSATDETPLQGSPNGQYGVNYYRLKIVENDGKTTYSPIRSVNMILNKNTDFTIFPNPTNDILNVKFNAESTQILDFELISIAGQVVHKYRLEGKQGVNHLYFRTSLFPKGQYLLRIKQGDKIVTEKVTID